MSPPNTAMIRFAAVVFAVAQLAGCAGQPPVAGAPPADASLKGVSPESRGETAVDPAVRALHESLLVLDSHLDTPALFHRATYNFSQRGSFGKDGTSVDLPRMDEGGLDGGFWVIYTPQGKLDDLSFFQARGFALIRQTAIREMAAKYADVVELAFNAEDAQRIHDAGKIVVFQSMENAYPLGRDLSLLETFYVGGLRMIGPVHFRNNQFADSATDDTAPFGGLSPLGETLIKEANRLGLILDGSHASDDALRDMMELSSTPVMLSHSGPDGVYSHPRNVPDELLKELAARGGVVHVNAFGSYLEALEPTPQHSQAMAALAEEYGSDPASLPPERMVAYRAARREVFRQHPPPRSTFEKYLEHLLHVLELVGPDHVGIGADWDGGGGVRGMEDVAALPKVTQALVDAGYTATDLEKIWSGNLLRLMREVETARSTSLASPNVLR